LFLNRSSGGRGRRGGLNHQRGGRRRRGRCDRGRGSLNRSGHRSRRGSWRRWRLGLRCNHNGLGLDRGFSGAGRSDRRFHHHCHALRRHHCHCRTCWNCGACRRPGDHGSGGRTRGDSGRRRRLNDTWFLADRRHDLARLGTRRCSRRWGHRHNRRTGPARDRRRGRRRGTNGRMASAGCVFRFLFLGQNGLHNVAGLGDVGQVDFGLNALSIARGRT
jgi:hypothetical protein